jgi:hypothetical protein
MKKLLYLCLLAASAFVASAQEPAPSSDFDSKNRFGLRISPQPTWFVSGDKNNLPAGSVLGFGFGLNLELRFSKIAGLVTGIGGDFEGGRYTVKNEPGAYEVMYWTDEAGELMAPTDPRGAGVTGYHLKERKVNTTFATIPAILKLSTSEYGGLKYFGMFGGEIGFRIKARAKDTFYSYTTYDSTGAVLHPGEFEESDININEEAGKIPLRFGMNVGAGAEYRLGGSTSLFFSLNFFRNFNNFFQKESDFMVYRTEAGGYKFVRQDLKLTGIRINVGILF